MTDAPITRREAGADPYRWLEQRDSAEVLEHLKAENAYLEAQLAEQTGLRETLFQEIKGRIRETDLSYGLYLYGWPAAQLVQSVAPGGPWHNTLWATLLAGGLAAMSWFAIERPALRLKRRLVAGRSAAS